MVTISEAGRKMLFNPRYRSQQARTARIDVITLLLGIRSESSPRRILYEHCDHMSHSWPVMLLLRPYIRTSQTAIFFSFHSLDTQHSNPSVTSREMSSFTPLKFAALVASLNLVNAACAVGGIPEATDTISGSEVIEIAAGESFDGANARVSISLFIESLKY